VLIDVHNGTQGYKLFFSPDHCIDISDVYVVCHPIHTLFIVFQVTSDSPLAVIYFMPTKGKCRKGKPPMFTGDGESYRADHADILKVLDEPGIEMVGSRLFYTFPDM
jgi:hypothetical protein